VIVKSAQYCAKLEGDLKNAIRSKRRGLWPLKRFKNLNLRFSPTQHTVQISRHIITIFSDRSKCVTWTPIN